MRLDPDPYYNPDEWITISVHPRLEDAPLVLRHDLDVRIPKLGLDFTIPKDFGWDGASIPFIRVLFRILRPFCVHDYLYRVKRLPRRLCDRTMLETMRYDGLVFYWRWPIYWGVRLGGWLAYWQDRKGAR